MAATLMMPLENMTLAISDASYREPTCQPSKIPDVILSRTSASNRGEAERPRFLNGPSSIKR
eukprot:m.41374 g.41374  ORF g.41374 m.41374 type:complete len:62 (-) comp46142_c0_seq1:266-451(-)